MCVCHGVLMCRKLILAVCFVCAHINMLLDPQDVEKACFSCVLCGMCEYLFIYSCKAPLPHDFARAYVLQKGFPALDACEGVSCLFSMF